MTSAELPDRPPRPLAVWVWGTAAYFVLIVLLGSLADGLNPEAAVFPPLLTALAGLFVATAINVRPATDEAEGPEWNRFQGHVIVVAITSMVFSIGLVMCAIAFPGGWVERTAFWAAAIAILIGASFLLSTVWERLGGNGPKSDLESVEKTEPVKEADPVEESEPPEEPEPDSDPEADKQPDPGTDEKTSKKSETRRAPQPDLVAETLKKTKKSKKSGKKKSKKPGKEKSKQKD